MYYFCNPEETLEIIEKLKMDIVRAGIPHSENTTS